LQVRPLGVGGGLVAGGGVFGEVLDSAAEFVSGGEGEVEALEVAGSFWS
jgi:hypothetical protein